jgi:hypothetical protein
MLNNSWNMSSSRRVNEPIEENKMMILMSPIAADPEENLGNMGRSHGFNVGYTAYTQHFKQIALLTPELLPNLPKSPKCP